MALLWIEYVQMTGDSLRRQTPDELLADIELEERRKRRGQLKVFLGYAGGVGKSYQMLDEGRRRLERGEDVVVCALQHKYPAGIKAILDRMEIITTLKAGEAESIDVEAVLRRHPQVALIDGLAYDNPPGSPNAHRWQDVEQLLNAGISVIATVNVQYLQPLQDEVEKITGSRPPYIIPRDFFEEVAEIALVDAPPAESFLNGMIDRSTLLAEKHKLSRLRELALLAVAAVVDRQLESYLRSHGTEQTWGVHERIMVCVTPRTDATQMLESGRRNADRFQGEFYAVYVSTSLGSGQKILEQNLAFARKLGAVVEVLNGKDAAQAILRFAMERGITQIFVGHSSAPYNAWNRLRGDLIDRLIRSAEGIDVVVYPK